MSRPRPRPRAGGIVAASLLTASLLAVGLLAATSCSSNRTTPSVSSTSPRAASTADSATTTPAVAVQSGFGGAERFCAQPPLSGTISYDGTSGYVRIALAVGGLPAGDDILLNWLNNTVRGYAIAAFRTDRAGNSVQSSLRVFRPGETRGYQILLAKAELGGAALGRLDPCR